MPAWWKRWRLQDKLPTAWQICCRRIIFASSAKKLFTELAFPVNYIMCRRGQENLPITFTFKRFFFWNCWHNSLTTIWFADNKNLLTIFSDTKNFAYGIGWQTEKNADKEKPCRLGWINVMALWYNLASRQSENCWRPWSTVSRGHESRLERAWASGWLRGNT